MELAVQQLHTGENILAAAVNIATLKLTLTIYHWQHKIKNINF
jgi:hypothetical protein